MGVACGAVLLSGCAAVGPNFERPEAPVLSEWSVAPGDAMAVTPIDLTAWWRQFEDPVLNDLVARALAANNTLEIAALNVLEARAQLGLAQGSRWPQTQVAAGDASYRSPPDNQGLLEAGWRYGLGANASWELDFWGRYRRAIEAADAVYLASRAAHEQAQVLVTASVVQGYTAVRTLEEQLRIARENLALQQRSFDIAGVLFRNGQSSELDVQQAQTLLLATRATIPDIEAGLRQARNALSLLLGELPGGVEERLAAGAGIPALPADLAVGIPADLLRRRPDVRQAEYLAMAANAQVGLAEADLYPSFSLTGSVGLSAGGGSSDFGDLFDGDALSWSVGPSLVWPFLNYGRIRNNVRVQDARLQQALIAYRDTALRAAQEAEDAMAAYTGAVAQADILVETVVSARRSNELATLRYSEGYSDYQRVLDAQQALFNQAQRLASVQGAAVGALVDLYRALGGGWTEAGLQPRLMPETREALEQRTNWGDYLEAAETTTPGEERP